MGLFMGKKEQGEKNKVVYERKRIKLRKKLEKNKWL
jgi:hypothetical protein